MEGKCTVFLVKKSASNFSRLLGKGFFLKLFMLLTTSAMKSLHLAKDSPSHRDKKWIIFFSASLLFFVDYLFAPEAVSSSTWTLDTLFYYTPFLERKKKYHRAGQTFIFVRTAKKNVPRMARSAIVRFDPGSACSFIWYLSNIRCWARLDFNPVSPSKRSVRISVKWRS